MPFIAYGILACVALQRLGELLLDRRNTRALRAQGAIEAGAGHYPLFILLHAAWLIIMAVAIDPSQQPAWSWIGLFVLLQAGRIWVIATLGRYWTTRIITLPGRPLVRRGPYRLCRHPNYLIVAFEIPVLPLAFHLPVVAAIFGIGNLALIAYRIRMEAAALAPRRLLMPEG